MCDGDRVSGLEDEAFWSRMVVMGAQQRERAQCPLKQYILCYVF